LSVCYHHLAMPSSTSLRLLALALVAAFSRRCEGVQRADVWELTRTDEGPLPASGQGFVEDEGDFSPVFYGRALLRVLGGDDVMGGRARRSIGEHDIIRHSLREDDFVLNLLRQPLGGEDPQLISYTDQPLGGEDPQLISYIDQPLGGEDPQLISYTDQDGHRLLRRPFYPKWRVFG